MTTHIFMRRRSPTNVVFGDLFEAREYYCESTSPLYAATPKRWISGPVSVEMQQLLEHYECFLPQLTFTTPGTKGLWGQLIQPVFDDYDTEEDVFGGRRVYWPFDVKGPVMCGCGATLRVRVIPGPLGLAA